MGASPHASTSRVGLLRRIAASWRRSGTAWRWPAPRHRRDAQGLPSSRGLRTSRTVPRTSSAAAVLLLHTPLAQPSQLNCPLSSGATQITGVSSRAMLGVLIEGERDPAVLAELTKGRLRNKISRGSASSETMSRRLAAAVSGCVRPSRTSVRSEPDGDRRRRFSARRCPQR